MKIRRLFAGETLRARECVHVRRNFHGDLTRLLALARTRDFRVSRKRGDVAQHMYKSG